MQPAEIPENHLPGAERDQLRRRLERLPPGHPSSPYEEDGTRKTGLASLRDLELPPSDRQSGEQAEPARVRQPSGQRAAPDHAPTDSESPADWPGQRDGGDQRDGDPRLREEPPELPAARSWPDALPDLRAQWDRHLQRWPRVETPRADRPADETGSWRGEAGQYLNAEENLAAGHALERVAAAEPAVRRTLRAVEAAVPGARLVGLEHSLKGEDRCKEKIAAELRAKPDRSIRQITDDIPDAMRYTFALEPRTYTADCRNLIEQVSSQGLEIELSETRGAAPNTRASTRDGGQPMT